MTTHHRDEDDPLLGELRNLFAQDDPVPQLVTEIAKASLGWRRLDADLAELLADSLDTESFAVARGGASLRSVSFGTDALTVDAEIDGDGAQRTLLGQLSPSIQTKIEIQTAAEAPPTVVHSDRLGRFRATLTAGRSIRLRVAVGDPERPDWIETSWISV
jgi:hypothetical protein